MFPICLMVGKKIKVMWLVQLSALLKSIFPICGELSPHVPRSRLSRAFTTQNKLKRISNSFPFQDLHDYAFYPTTPLRIIYFSAPCQHRRVRPPSEKLSPTKNRTPKLASHNHPKSQRKFARRRVSRQKIVNLPIKSSQ